MNAVRTASVAVAGLVALALAGAPASVASSGSDPAVKRNEDTPDLVLVADRDDDDTNDRLGADMATRSKATRSKATRSKASRDHTNSRYTAVSRDRDKSRGDLTRDWTMDGGERTRDWSKNSTNDNTRNDTRGRG